MNVIPPAPSLLDELKKDIWVHIGGLIAIAIGVFDVFYGKQLGIATDLIFIIGGFAAQGVKIVNGSANAAAVAAVSAINNISGIIAQQQQDLAVTAASALKAKAVTTAQGVTDKAAETAADLAKAP